MSEDGLGLKWKKAEIILKPVGGLIAAFVIAVMGYLVNGAISARQDKESNYRLYSELINQRESAESALRKDMFTKIISEFINPDSASIESKLLQLELLTYNFHESLNLQPLFKHEWRLINSKRFNDVSNEDSTATKHYMKRLRKVANENISRQVNSLEMYGKVIGRTVSWEGLEPMAAKTNEEDYNTADCVYEVDFSTEFILEVDGITRAFKIYILETNVCTEELYVELEISIPKNTEWHKAAFHIGYYDFPLIDNMRLSNNQRAALVMRDFQVDDSSAEFALIYFPGRFASLKERTYTQDILDEILKAR